LIKTGNGHGVKKMKIKVGHKAGVDIGTSFEGIAIKVKTGNQGSVDLEVEY
jgi:hypothetical protein